MASLMENEIARIASPPVTAIRVPYEKLGYEAARILHRMIEGKRVQQKK